MMLSHLLDSFGLHCKLHALENWYRILGMISRHRETITFSGQGCTRLEVARLIIQALRANERVGGFEYDPEIFRQKERHEICHHLPVDGKLAVVRGHLLSNSRCVYIAEKVSITHSGLTSLEEVISSLAPLGDKRIRQELSPEDIDIATTNYYRLITDE